MSVARARRTMCVLAGLILTLLVTAAPAGAASDPVAAVEALTERIRAGDLADLDGLVCESERAGLRGQFDIVGQVAESTGLAPAEIASSVSLSLDDISTELVSENEDAAVVRLEARLIISIDEALAEAFVRSLADEFGEEEVPEAELAGLAATLIGQMSEPRDIDEDIGVVREGDEWVVCDPFATGEDPFAGSVAEVSFEGLCGLVTIDEVNATGVLEFDSSSGGDDVCSYTTSGSATYVSLGGIVDRVNGIGDFAFLFPDGRAVTVAGQTGLVADGVVYVGLPDGGTFVVTLYIDDVSALPGPIDVEAQQLAFAELLVPLIPAADPDDTGSTIDPFGLELPLCDALSLDELSELSGRTFDTLDGDGEFCNYSTTDPEQGFNVVTLSITPGAAVAEFAEFLPGGEPTTVGGVEAYEVEGQLFIDTPVGLFIVDALGSDRTGAESFDPRELGEAIFRLVAPRLEDLEPVGRDVGSGDAPAAGPFVPSDESLCSLLDLDALNALGPLTYDDVFDGGADLCVYTATAPDQGFHSLSIFTESFELAGIRDVYDTGTASTIAGREAYGHDETLWLQLDDRVLAISPLLDEAAVDAGTDVLGFAALVAELIAARDGGG